MSILLDAVTRAKNQELDDRIDPVLTPRGQYDNFSGNRQRKVTLLLSVFIALLLVVIAWLGLGYLVNARQITPQIAVHPLAQALQQEPKETQNPSFRLDSLGDGSSVRLAGKVALPVAVQAPSTVRYLDPKPQSSEYAVLSGNLAPAAISAKPSTKPSAVAATTAVTDSSASEPVILGADANQKGQDMLAALKLEVNQAASDVGFETTPVTPKNYQEENDLLAAFEAALTAVEVRNSLAAPMTALELDPMPATKPDTLPTYGQLPAGLQLQVPQFNIRAHVYSTDPDKRGLNVDGAELHEGDSIGGKLDIVEIRSKDVVLSIQGTQFKVPAI